VRRYVNAVTLKDFNDAFRVLDDYKVRWVLLGPEEPLGKALVRSALDRSHPPRARHVAREENQRQHYETILGQYDAHYNDKWSAKYREEFIYEPLWRGLDFAGMRVADLACGSGFNSGALLKRFPTVLLTGYDIGTVGLPSLSSKNGFSGMGMRLDKAYECTFAI